MNRNPIIAIIVEGESREISVLKNLINIYFNQKRYELFYFQLNKIFICCGINEKKIILK